MSKLRREYTLRILKNAEPKIVGQKNAESTFLNLYSNKHSYSQFFIAFISYVFLKKLKTICVLDFLKFNVSLKLLLAREIYRRTTKPYSRHPI